MAAKKGGLGKGLEVLFAENSIEEEGKTVSLPISEIEPNRAQPRKQFDDEALAELSASISQHGVLQPLLAPARWPAAAISWWRANAAGGLPAWPA